MSCQKIRWTILSLLYLNSYVWEAHCLGCFFNTSTLWTNIYSLKISSLGFVMILVSRSGCTSSEAAFTSTDKIYSVSSKLFWPQHSSEHFDSLKVQIRATVYIRVVLHNIKHPPPLQSFRRNFLLNIHFGSRLRLSRLLNTGRTHLSKPIFWNAVYWTDCYLI